MTFVKGSSDLLTSGPILKLLVAKILFTSTPKVLIVFIMLCFYFPLITEPTCRNLHPHPKCSNTTILGFDAATIKALSSSSIEIPAQLSCTLITLFVTVISILGLYSGISFSSLSLLSIKL